MGTSQSTNVSKPRINTRPFGQIYIETDTKAYYEEEMVTGHIHMDLYRHYGKSELLIEFKGKEKSHFVVISETNHRTDDIDWSTTNVSDYNSKGELYQSTFTIHKWDDLAVGQYSVPFSIRLPKGLYSSYDSHHTKNRNTYKASVMYRLTATLKPDVISLPPIKYKHQINIRSTPPEHNLNQSKRVETRAISFLCFDKGKTTVNIELDRSFANYGETLPVKITVDNSQSKIPSSTLTVKLVQDLTLKAENYTFSEKNFKYKERLGSIPAGKISQEHLINIEMTPGSMHSSVDVGLVQSKFALEIEIGDAGCSGSMKVCRFPIHVGCGDGVYIPLIAPPNWNPMQISAVNVGFEVGAAFQKAIDAGFSLLDNNKDPVGVHDMVHHGGLYKPPLQYYSGNKFL